jgi:dGTPase
VKSRLYAPSDETRLGAAGAGDAQPPGWRTAYRRDYARLLHSAAFRRLQGKTQLFAGEESDFFRNRLTHSLEVAQIAGAIALKLNHETLAANGLSLDLDLVQLAGLAHDLGHPPFGHTGEHELDDLMRETGGFEGNAQTLRLLARIEKKLVGEDQLVEGSPRWYANGTDAGLGLDLTVRSLAAVMKYGQMIPEARGADAPLVKGYYATEQPVVEAVRKAVGEPPEGCSQTLECQIMDLADDIAYSTYDIEDAFHAGLLTPLDLIAAPPHLLGSVAERCAKELGRAFELGDVEEVLNKEVFPHFSANPSGSSPDHLRSLYRASKQTAGSSFFRGALTSSLVDRAVRAVSVDVATSSPVYSRIWMEPKARAVVSVLKHLTYSSLIDSPKMKLVAVRGKAVVRTIFDRLMEKGGAELLPGDWADRFEQAPAELQPRVVCDFVAGMTDRQALDFYCRLTSSSFRSMFGLH